MNRFYLDQFGESFLIHKLPTICTMISMRCVPISSHTGTGDHSGMQSTDGRDYLRETGVAFAEAVMQQLKCLHDGTSSRRNRPEAVVS